jgi:heme O synthase-like polyprenyltransferase
MKKFLPSAIVFGLTLFPVLVYAQAPRNLTELIKRFTDLVQPVINLLTGLAVLFFIWGIVKYIMSAGDEKSKVSAKNTMVYGVIALTVLFSFMGIVRLLKTSFFG